MKKKILKNPILKSWLRTVAIAAAILMFIVVIAIIWLSSYTRHGERFLVPSFAGMTIDEAMSLSEEMDIQFDIIDSIYIESMLPGAILDQYPKAGNYIKSGRRITITTNTFAPKNVKIPYITGYSLRQAKNRLISSGLQINKLIYVEDIATNNVIRQEYNGIEMTPKSDITVPVNSQVTLYVGLGNDAPLLKAPNLMGELLYIAKDKLWDEGLNVTVQNSENIVRELAQKATVYKQYPLPGDSISFGEVVTISITMDSTKIKNGLNSYKSRENKINHLRGELFNAKELLLNSSEEEMEVHQQIVNELTMKLDSLTTI